MSHYSLVGLLILTSFTAQAQTNEPSKLLGGGLIGTGVVSGVAGIRYFNIAGKTRAVNTSHLVPQVPTANAISSTEIEKVTAPVENGDEIAIKYHLNPERNKELWISQTQESISSAESSARHHDLMSMTAMKPRYEYRRNAQGQMQHVYVGQEADMLARFQHAAQANSARNRASSLRNDLMNVQTGRAIAPTIVLEKEIMDLHNAKAEVKNFMEKEAGLESKFYMITRLPNSARLKVRAANIKGGIFITIAFASTATGLWELTSGEISKALNSTEQKLSDL